MPRKPTGKVIKNRAEVPQKNGDIHIYESEYQFNHDNHEIKKTKRISNRLAAKVPKGTGKVSSRAERTSKAISLAGSQNNGQVASNIYVSRQHTNILIYSLHYYTSFRLKNNFPNFKFADIPHNSIYRVWSQI